VIKRSLALAALGGLIALPACTSGQVGPPPVTQINPATNSKLQFQVGTANLNGTPGLNTVVTFRQTSGFSAVLADTPTITLPFVNTAPASAAGNDSGTNQISGSPQVALGTPSVPSTFGTAVGAFAYGFLAVNSNTAGSNSSVFYPSANRMPYYAAGTRRAFYVGPGNPVVNNFRDGSLPADFIGYPSGFTTFALAPTTGAYSLTVAINSTNATVPSFTSTTAMTSTAMLPVMPTPVYASDGVGGGTVAVTVPPGVTETLVFLHDVDSATATFFGNVYTLRISGTGPQVATLPPNIGPITGGVAGASVPKGDRVRAIAVGFDYPALEAVPIGSNPPQTPVINNLGAACTFSSNTASACTGQADLTASTNSPPLITE
jgi:hypothetical protein